MPSLSDSAKYSGLSLIPTAISAAVLYGVWVKGVSKHTFSSSAKNNKGAKIAIMVAAFLLVVWLLNMVFMQLDI